MTPLSLAIISLIIIIGSFLLAGIATAIAESLDLDLQVDDRSRYRFLGIDLVNILYLFFMLPIISPIGIIGLLVSAVWGSIRLVTGWIG